jgi:hypothetical protein
MLVLALKLRHILKVKIEKMEKWEGGESVEELNYSSIKMEHPVALIHNVSMEEISY